MTKPIFDEVAWQNLNKDLKQTLVTHGKAIGKAAENLKHAMVGADGSVRAFSNFGASLTSNVKWWGAEGLSLDELAREEKRRKRKIEREKCQHGRVSFRIGWPILLICPRCTQDSVLRQDKRMWCLLCDWQRPRI